MVSDKLVSYVQMKLNLPTVKQTFLWMGETLLSIFIAF